MNFLAHCFLSGNDDELLVGNFIADSVKGQQKQWYPPGIIRGIELHRQIDMFTDAHPVVRQTKDRLRPGYGKFAGVIADMFYDHYLAVHFDQYSAVALPEYAQHVYAVMQQHYTQLPERVQYFLPYMIDQNWLTRYAQVAGIRSSLRGLSRRALFASNMATATDELEMNYAHYQRDFALFFPELQYYVKQIISRW